MLDKEDWVENLATSTDLSPLYDSSFCCRSVFTPTDTFTSLDVWVDSSLCAELKLTAASFYEVSEEFVTQSDISQNVQRVTSMSPSISKCKTFIQCLWFVYLASCNIGQLFYATNIHTHMSTHAHTQPYVFLRALCLYMPAQDLYLYVGPTSVVCQMKSLTVPADRAVRRRLSTWPIDWAVWATLCRSRGSLSGHPLCCWWWMHIWKEANHIKLPHGYLWCIFKFINIQSI